MNRFRMSSLTESSCCLETEAPYEMIGHLANSLRNIANQAIVRWYLNVSLKAVKYPA